jgi:hypothetical protein
MPPAILGGKGVVRANPAVDRDVADLVDQLGGTCQEKRVNPQGHDVGSEIPNSEYVGGIEAVERNDFQQDLFWEKVVWKASKDQAEGTICNGVRLVGVILGHAGPDELRGGGRKLAHWDERPSNDPA